MKGLPNTRSIFQLSRLIGLSFLIMLFAAQLSYAQSGGAWEEEDDDEDSVDTVVNEEFQPAEAMRYDDVVIHINGKELNITADYKVKREDTLDIQVRHLAPGSAVIIEVKKGGINFKRKVFYSNNKGELDLEVKTGSKKVSGDAVLYYTPKGNSKKTLEVKIVVE